MEPKGSIVALFLELKVEVLPSLQKPKKITIVGSDGNAYILLCKPKVIVFVMPLIYVYVTSM